MSDQETSLWEIMVPTVRNDGKPFRTRYHRVWDDKVRAISGGLTIMPVAKGQWVDQSNKKLYRERMIPVRIACSKEEIVQIMDMTAKFYDQLAVMAYRVSDLCLIRDRQD